MNSKLASETVLSKTYSWTNLLNLKLQTRESLKTQLETSKIKPKKSSLFTIKLSLKKNYLSQNLEIKHNQNNLCRIQIS